MKKAKKTVILGICLAIMLSLGMTAKGKAVDYKFNMSYIFFSNTSDYTAMVDNAQNSLNEVSPNYFALTGSGGLTLTSSVSATFVDDMHKRGITVVPFLSNDWSRTLGKAALANRVGLAKSLAEAVVRYNLDGVNIDIENVTSAERAAYVEFVRTLRELMEPGKTIAVSVAPNPWGISTGWQGSYDYAGLAEYCDYLIIMGYDEHYYGGPAGPVSSYSYLDKSLKYAVSLVPKEKVVLGLPFYGRIWSNSGGFPGGYGLTNAQIAKLIKNYGGTVRIDPVSQSTKAVINVAPRDVKPVVGGQSLAAGTYTIWYENEQSIKTKLELVNKYNIKGTGSWALGQETDSTWNYYKLWLNNCTFSDAQNSWAKDYIMNAYLNSWVSGYSADNFSPDAPLTRSQAAVILVRRLGLTAELDPAYRFDDCVGGWSQAYIETARKYHIITGVGDNLFDPDRPVSRQELAVMLNNVLNYQNIGGGAVFTDVTPHANPWSYGDIQALSAGGVLAGYPDGTYKPFSSVSRAEMAVLISRMSVTTPIAPPVIFSGDTPTGFSPDIIPAAAPGPSPSPSATVPASVPVTALS